MTSAGYGNFNAAGKAMVASRFAYLDMVGEIPQGMLVLHRCDNPLCVNPAHLFLGTDKDNSDDKISKGRWRKVKKVTPDLVASLRRDYTEAKYKYGLFTAMARDHGLDPTTVRNIVLGLKCYAGAEHV